MIESSLEATRDILGIQFDSMSVYSVAKVIFYSADRRCKHRERASHRLHADQRKSLIGGGKDERIRRRIERGHVGPGPCKDQTIPGVARQLSIGCRIVRSHDKQPHVLSQQLERADCVSEALASKFMADKQQ